MLHSINQSKSFSIAIYKRLRPVNSLSAAFLIWRVALTGPDLPVRI